MDERAKALVEGAVRRPKLGLPIGSQQDADALFSAIEADRREAKRPG